MAEITNIACRRLHPHPDNPRKELGDLTELAASIRENGIFQNLTVIPGHYMTAEEYADSVAADGGSRQSAMAVWNPKSCGLRMTTPSSSGIAGLRPHNRQDCLKCPAWSWKWTKGNSCKP